MRRSIQSGDFDYEVNSRGYMITFRNKRIGGAGISNDAPNPRGKNVKANIELFTNEAEITIRDILSGKDKRFDDIINKIAR